MTLEKAIELLAEQVYAGSVTFNEDWKDAVKLSIEGLKWRLHCELVGYVETCDLLPGETQV